MANITWNITANESGTEVAPAADRSEPVDGYLNMEGVFDGGTITWESRPIGGSAWTPINGMEFTDEEGGTFVTHPGIEYRPTMAGSNESTTDVDITYTRPGG